MNAALRVLIILPMYGGSLPVGRYCATALEKMGHVVEIFEAPAFHTAFTALKELRVGNDRLEYLENSFLQVVSQAILAKVEHFSPDLVLALAQAPLSRQALHRLRREGVPTAMWFVEDFRLFTYWRSFAPYYDIFAVIQKEPFFSELEAVGQPNTLYLPMAADPEFHRPLELSPREQHSYGSDVSFVGAGYPNRRRAFRQLMHLDFKIWGSDWEGETVLRGLLQRDGERIAPDACVRIFNAAKVNLNLHSSVQAGDTVVRGDFVNPRTFELASCGAFQLVDRRELLPELFAADELATFEDMDTLTAGIRHYLENPDERREMANRARARVLAEHTYEHRMRTLLDFAATRLPGWPRKRVVETAASVVPQDVRAELDALLVRCKLPADAAFDDVVWTLRGQEGALTELETALLFLDEWRKQYGK